MPFVARDPIVPVYIKIGKAVLPVVVLFRVFVEELASRDHAVTVVIFAAEALAVEVPLVGSDSIVAVRGY